MQKSEKKETILVDRYQILSKIGARTYGQVYKCMDLQTEKEIAAKALKFNKGNNNNEYKTFLLMHAEN